MSSSSSSDESDVFVTALQSTLTTPPPPSANSTTTPPGSIPATQPEQQVLPPELVMLPELGQPNYQIISTRSHTLDDSLWRIQMFLDSELMYRLMDPYERCFTRTFYTSLFSSLLASLFANECARISGVLGGEC